jgi:hypothetical protein
MPTDGRTDRRRDITKLIVAFRNFAIAHKNKHWRHVRPNGDCKYLMQSDLDENDRCYSEELPLVFLLRRCETQPSPHIPIIN